MLIRSLNDSELMDMTDHGFISKVCGHKFDSKDELQKHKLETHPEMAKDM
jgi:hypothetical protein